MRRHLAPLLIALAVLVPLAGCGDDGDDGVSAENATTAPAEDPLAGRTFVSTELESDIASLVEGFPVRITFGEDDEITIDTGCTPATGTYSVQGPILDTRDVSRPEVGCLPGLTEQDAFISNAMSSRPVITLTPPDGLVLSDDEWTLTMVDADAAPATLAGPSWTLEDLVDGGETTPAPEGVSASIAFTPDGAYEVFAGCNTGRGTYTPPGGGATIEVEPPALTRQRCDDDAMELEARIVATLDGAVTVGLEANRLSLTNSAGDGVTFTAG
jgi:heat shock protein HslJ